MEKVADQLWQKVNTPHIDEPEQRSDSEYIQDIFRYWEHLHRHIPFKVYKWWYRGWPMYQMRKLFRFQEHFSYDDNRMLTERVEYLLDTKFYKSIKSLRRYPILCPILPKPYK